ncbi:MAG: hypothetical protein ABIQ57_17990 [Candidatus Kapaibacterium sp.]
MAFAGLHAQGVSSPCLDEVRSIYQRLTAASRGADAMYLEYTVTSAMRDSSLRPTTSHIVAVSNRTRLRVVSREMEVYSDERNVFTVVPARKEVYLADRIPGGDSERIAGVPLLRDGLLSRCSVISCGDVAGTADKSIVLHTTDTGPFAKTIAIVYNRDAAMIRSIGIRYDAGEIASIDMRFTRVNYHYADTVPVGPVSTLVLNADGTFLPKYDGYRLIDVREKDYHGGR